MKQEKIMYKINDVIIEGDIYIIPANPVAGFNIGYSLFIPNKCQTDTVLILGACNSSYTNSSTLKDAQDVVEKSVKNYNLSMWLANDLKMPMMTPLIPRVYGFLSQALGSRVLNNDISLIYESNNFFPKEQQTSEIDIEEIKRICKDLPLQVTKIIDHSKQFLNTLKISVEEKIIIEGYSTGSKFANLFTALYPEKIKACISGGGTGLGIIPLTKYKNKIINYPIGVNNLKKFDVEEFKSVSQLYYIGIDDMNDPAQCKYETIIKNNKKVFLLDADGKKIPILDKNNCYIANYSDNYTDEEVHLIHTLLGFTPIERFRNQAQIYATFGVNSIFKEFTGDHSTVTSYFNNDEVNQFKKQFIQNVLAKDNAVKNNLK